MSFDKYVQIPHFFCYKSISEPTNFCLIPDSPPKKHRRIMAQGMNTRNALTRPQVDRNIVVPGLTTVKSSTKKGQRECE